MPVDTLSCQPSSFRSGDTVRFKLKDSDFPHGTWTLAFTLRGKNLLTVAGLADPDDAEGFLVVLTAANTAALFPGRYMTIAVFSQVAGGEKASLDTGGLVVTPNLADTSTGPRRAAYLVALAALEAWPVNKFASFNINGQSITYHSISDLQKLVDRLYIDALNEDRERGIPAAGGLVRIVTRM